MQNHRITPQLLASRQYLHPDRTAVDVDYVCMRYSLSHAFRVSPSEPARGPMLCLEGYIPYVFAHATYNASVNIWIPPQYPALPPRLLVFAGPGTMLNPNPHLDQNGLFYHSYLTEWSSNPNTHNLMDAISIAVETFDMISPVISAPPAFNAASHPSSQAGTPRSAAGTPNGYGRTSTPPSAAARMTPPSNSRDAEDQLEAVRRSSLMSAVQERLQRDYDTIQEDVLALKQEENYLQESKKRLTTEVERLIQQHEVIVLNNSRLEQENMQRAERIALLTSKPQLTVEDIGATAPLYAQLYSLIAEEQADEDALYALSKTLERGQIEVQAYLKAVRSLARDQFMKKALINKIVAYAHIPK